MIRFYTYNLETGKILESGYYTSGNGGSYLSQNLNKKMVKGKQATTLQYHNLDTDMLSDRPQLNIDNITLNIDEEYNPENIPAGTIVYVDDEDVGIVDNTGLILVFPVAKTYTVKLVPPFPYFEKTVTIEVI